MLSVIVPTYNEAENIRKLIPGIREALKGISHEIIVVDDDSPDETWRVGHELGVRVRRRRGERGLALAVIEGFSATKGEVLIVMDADGQHDVKLLPKLHGAISAGRDVAIASRYIKGGSTADWRGYRLLGSRFVTFLARFLCPRGVTDPLSGYFAMNRKTFRSIENSVRPRGFKILLEVLAHLPPDARIGEVPLRFGLRAHGRSKLSAKVQVQFVVQILSLLRRTSRGQFIVFCVGLATIAALLAPRVWSLRLLYRDSLIRANMRTRIEDVSEEQGWLLSDIDVVNVGRTTVRFIHRNHIRGADPEMCYLLHFKTSELTPCAVP